MSHLHFPDGFLPLWLWLGGLIIAGIILAIILIYLSRRRATKEIAMVGVLAGLMIVGMLFEIVPLGYHVNLAIPVGIILGPALGFLTAFVTNLFLALMGHGGITVVGLNTLLLGIEVTAGWLLFKKIVVIQNVFRRTFISSIIALAISTTITVGIIWSVAPEHLAKKITFEGEWFHFELSQDNHEEEELVVEQPNLAIIYLLSGLGWIIEATIGASLINYLNKVKPGSVKL